MPKQFLLGTGTVAALAGMLPAHLNKWIENGIVRPSAVAGGSGSRNIWQLPETLAVLLIREARRRGMPLSTAASIGRFLADRTTEGLLADFAADRCLIVIVGDVALERLLSHDELADPGDANIAAVVATGTAVAAVDVRRAYEQVVAALDAAKPSCAAEQVEVEAATS